MPNLKGNSDLEILNFKQWKEKYPDEWERILVPLLAEEKKKNFEDREDLEKNPHKIKEFFQKQIARLSIENIEMVDEFIKLQRSISFNNYLLKHYEKEELLAPEIKQSNPQKRKKERVK